MQWKAQSEKVKKQETLVSETQKNHPRNFHRDTSDCHWNLNPDVLKYDKKDFSIPRGIRNFTVSVTEIIP